MPILLRMTWAWLLALTAANVGLCWLFWPSHQAAAALKTFSMPLAEVIIPLLLSTAIGASIAVGWHRVVLLDVPPEHTLYVRFDQVVLRYFFASFLFLLPLLAMLSAPMLAVSQLDFSALAAVVFSAIFAFIAFVILSLRLGFILPAIALQRDDIKLRTSWNVTAGSVMRLFASSAILIILIALPFIVFALLTDVDVDPAPAETFTGYLISSLVSEITGVLFGIIGVTVLSLQFRHFFRETFAA